LFILYYINIDVNIDWFGNDIKIVETVFFKDVNIYIDLGIIRSILNRIFYNNINEII